MTDSPASAQPLGERGLLGEGAEEHGAECVERLDDSPVREAVAHGGAVALGRDEAPLAEHLEMPRYRGLRHVESLGELADVLRTLGEGVEDEDALRVRERLTDAGVKEVHFFLEAFVHWRTPFGGRPAPERSTPVDERLEKEVNLLHASICQALADPKRILILYALSEGPKNVSELTEALDVPQPTVSRLSLIHISEPTRLGMISYAVFCLK